MAEFGKGSGVGNAAGLNGNAPQPSPYDFNPPAYSEICPPYPAVHQKTLTPASTGYQTNYRAAAPYPLYPTYPAAPPPQYAGYQKSPVVYVPQSTAPPPALPYFVNQQHPSSICVVNPQNHATTYVVNQQRPGSTYIVNQQRPGSTYVVNQQHPAAPVVMIQPGNAARGNHIIYGCPTVISQQSTTGLINGLATSVLSGVEHAINPKTGNKGKQVTIQTGGSSVIIYK
ncbi:uncharacterized protein LOC144508507 isoform X2 [Mustelus asterias]